MARRTWYRLDNIGKFYSSQAGRSSQTVFRYSADLADDIDPDILQHALDHAIAQFPSFNVHLLNGMFWHYLEQSDGRPLVEPEHLPICSRLLIAQGDQEHDPFGRAVHYGGSDRQVAARFQKLIIIR